MEGMLKNYSTNCQCGKVNVNLALPNSIESYELRACDCEFCQNNRLTYLSDSDGNMLVASAIPLIQRTQGSEQATFWQCSSCGDVVVVTALLNGEMKGAVNGQLFTRCLNLRASIVVSPKFLSPKEKRNRWACSWLRVRFRVKSPVNDTA